MSTTKEKFNDFSAVNPNDVYQYLQKQGWQEEGKIDTRASILSIRQGEKKFSVLLPLVTEIADYYSRIYDVFKTLEEFEKRPRSEIVKGFLSANAVAKARNQEILSLKFECANGDHLEELTAISMGEILISLQNLCYVLGQVDTDQLVNKIEDISQEVLDQTELSVFEIFKGSLGIRLSFAPSMAQSNPQAASIAERVAEKFIELIKLSDSFSTMEIQQFLVKLAQPILRYAYIGFLKSLIKSRLNLEIDWGSTNPEKGDRAQISYERMNRIIEQFHRLRLDEEYH